MLALQLVPALALLVPSLALLGQAGALPEARQQAGFRDSLPPGPPALDHHLPEVWKSCAAKVRGEEEFHSRNHRKKKAQDSKTQQPRAAGNRESETEGSTSAIETEGSSCAGPCQTFPHHEKVGNRLPGKIYRKQIPKHLPSPNRTLHPRSKPSVPEVSRVCRDPENAKAVQRNRNPCLVAQDPRWP